MSTTKIVRTHRKYHSYDAPYICYGISHETDAKCPSFASAIDRAKEMGCDTVIVEKSDAPRNARLVGAKVGVDVVFSDAR